MTEQGSLFPPVPSDEHPRARNSDPCTSHAAARNTERFAKTHAGRILADLVARGPATVDQLSERVGLQSQQINKRLPELERDGLAYPEGVRRSHAGNLERIWYAKEQL